MEFSARHGYITKMSLALFKAVPAGAIEHIFAVDQKPFFKRADLGKYLKIADIGRNFKELNGDKKIRQEIQGLSGQGGTRTRLGMRGGGVNPHDVFLSLDAALDVAVKWKKTKAVELVKWLVKKGVDKIVEEHQLMIEEKDTQLALVNDDLQAREYENVGLQGEIRACERNIERLQQRYVNERGNIDNILIVIEKKDAEEEGKSGRHQYYVIRCQKQNQGTQLLRKNRKYSNMIIKGTCDDANAVHEWCCFKLNVLDRENYHFNHFSLETNEQREEFEDEYHIRM